MPSDCQASVARHTPTRLSHQRYCLQITATMNNNWYEALGLENLYALIWQPTIFWLGVCVLAVYEYLLFEARFDSSPMGFLVGGRTAWTSLPTHSLHTYKVWKKQGGIRSADKISDGDVCIICRDAPSAALQLSKCMHVLCKDCW